MQTVVAVILLAIALTLFWAWRTHRITNDTLNAIAAILTVVAGIAAIVLFVVPGASLPPFSPATSTPDNKSTISSPANTAMVARTPVVSESVVSLTLQPSPSPISTLPVPTLTSDPILLPGQDFDKGCIASQLWRHREEASTPKDDDECWLLGKFGIVAENGLKIQYAKALTYWLLTPIQTSNAEIHFKFSIHDITPINKGAGDAFVVFGVGNTEYNFFNNGHFLFYRRDQSESSKAKVVYGSASNTQFLTNYMYGTTHEVKIIVKATQMHLEVHDLSTREIWKKDFIITPAEREAFWIGYNISNGSNSSISALISELVVVTE